MLIVRADDTADQVGPQQRGRVDDRCAAHRVDLQGQRSQPGGVVAMLGFGPRLRPHQIVTVGGTFEIDYTLLMGSVDTANFLFQRVAVPVIQIATEITPWRWLVLRGGLIRRFDFTVNKPATGGQTDGSTDSFDIRTGAGVRIEKLEIDSVISIPLLLQGPNFIGGGSPGLFGNLSVRYPF